MKLTLMLIAAACAFAQPGLDRPFLGLMIDHGHSLRPVYGAGGSFTGGTPVAEQVLASACSLTVCLAKTQSALISGSTITPAPPGGAQIALDATGATIYFQRTAQFVHWQNGSLAPMSLSVSGTVLSLRSPPSGINLAVERSGVIWIIAADGSVLDALPPAAQTVLLLTSETVYATADSLVIRKSDGTEINFPAPGITALTALGDSYVEASAESVLYALRTVPGREQLFQLPQLSQREPRR